jgi:DNA-binding protein HU-alpha
MTKKPAGPMSTEKTAADMPAVPDATDEGGAVMKKKELIEQVVIRSGIKKKDAKPVVEAMLAVLGETVAAGREMNLQPFGKMSINRSMNKPNGRVVIVKLRQNTAKLEANSALAEPAEER